MAYVFISYSHKDKKYVDEATKAFSSLGVSYWYDEGIKAGEDWANTIGTKLEGAKLVLLFASKKSIKSKNVRREIAFAEEHGIPIITTQIGKFKLSLDLEKILTVNQFISLGGFRTYLEYAKTLLPVLSKYDVVSDKTCEYKDCKVKIKSGFWGIAVLVLIVIAILLSILSTILFGEVPFVIGREAYSAQDSVYDEGFVCDIADDYSNEEEFGYIFKQNKAGKAVKNSAVVITKSLGPDNDLVDVPAVVGFHISNAVKKLVEADIKTFVISPVVSKEYQIGYVVNQSIPARYRVSKYNEIVLGVASEKGTVIDINGKKVSLGDSKLKVEVTENEVVITPMMVFGVNASYSESVLLHENYDINALFSFGISASRENIDPFGKYRGDFSLSCILSGSDSFLWNAAKIVIGAEDTIDIIVSSSAFSFTAEPYNQDKFENFIIDNTGNIDNVIKYSKPIMMVLGKTIPVTEMNNVAKSISKLYSIASKLSIRLPKIENNELLLPYSMVFQENGEVWINLYIDNGIPGGMAFDGKILYE